MHQEHGDLSSILTEVKHLQHTTTLSDWVCQEDGSTFTRQLVEFSCPFDLTLLVQKPIVCITQSLPHPSVLAIPALLCHWTVPLSPCGGGHKGTFKKKGLELGRRITGLIVAGLTWFVS